jgi:formate hydrogenlyase transcriptional activator
MSTKSAEAELQRKNERLELLLNLTTAIASSLDLREILRAIAANIRAVMHADAVTVWLPDAASGKFKVFALDFPHGKGVIKEEVLVTLSAGAKKAIATLKPVVVDTRQRNEFASATSELATAEGIKALCGIPLVNRGRVIGILSAGRSTENPFIAEDVDFLSQASGLIAIAIENALTYQELREREAKIRRLVDANIVGICIWNVEGDIINTNEAFLKMVGYDRELFESASMRWTEMTPPEWRENDARILAELHVKGTAPPFEKELFRKDGSRVPILVGAALFEAGGTEGVAFVLDLSEQKRTEAKIQRQNERLGLLLNLTSKITSSLDPREVLRSIAANIREVIHADAVLVSLPDEASGKFKAFAVDFPLGKGVLREELLATPSTACKKAMDTLKPVIWDWRERDELAPEISDVAAAESVRVSCDIPLVSRGRALGNLGILRRTETPFMPEDIDFLSRSSGQIAIALENALAYREISELKDKLVQEKLYLEQEIRGEMHFEQIVGNSPALNGVLELVETVAPNDSTVLLLGETGTGKELIARAVHDRSRRKGRTFVKLNCAAIPTGLLESELFGHERGAFTGAVAQKVGRLELADQGTLFLDEVGDIPIEIQPKLLRALQEREFERLGSTHTRRVNVRLVAATNRDLEKMIREREFRSDLYYRLNVFPIRIPPLRERRDDIPLLVSYFVERFAKQMQKKIDSIPAAVMKSLIAWDWPGNIRELENLIERAVILTRGRSLEAPIAELQETKTDTPPPADRHKAGQVAGERTNSTDKTSIADEYARKQRDAIAHALTESKGRVGGPHGAAARLGTNRTTLLARMKKFGIDRREYA